MGRLGTRIYRAIQQNGIKNEIVVVDRTLPEFSFSGNKQTTFYNADLFEDEAYEMANMKSAQSIWVATSDDNDNLAITANILAKSNGACPKIFVHLYEHSLIKNFQAFFNSTANKEIHFFNIYDEIDRELSEGVDR
jgi:Trk K+ transport system NAD-binding subunit